MKIDQFLDVLNANRELLDAKTSCQGRSCPLRVVMLICCSDVAAWRYLYEGNSPINPDPADAEVCLGLSEEFVQAVANGWDHGRFYGDCENFDHEFAGFLTSIALRPAPLELTA